MSIRLFVGGLNYQTQEDGLKQWFEYEGFDVNKVQVVRDRVTGHSRGFGFVELGTEEHVDDVIRRLQGSRIDDRVVTINKADPKQPREQASREHYGEKRVARENKREFQR